jgi:hypothetical protein
LTGNTKYVVLISGLLRNMDLIKYKTSPRQSCALSPLYERKATVYTQVIELAKNLEKPHPVRSGHPSPC